MIAKSDWRIMWPFSRPVQVEAGYANRVEAQARSGGTKKLLAQYGKRLVCVRYRYDEERRERYKTVELIVDETVVDAEEKGCQE